MIFHENQLHTLSVLRSKLPIAGLHENARQRGMSEVTFIKPCLS